MSKKKVSTKKEELTLATLTAVIVILYAFRLTLQDSLLTKGIDLQKTQDETKVLETQNMELRRQVLQAQALTTIHDKAVAKGFVPATYLYLTK